MEICNKCKCCSMVWVACSQCNDGYYEDWGLEVELKKCGLCDGEGGGLACVDDKCNGTEQMK